MTEKVVAEECGVMPLFMVKKRNFFLFSADKKNVELRAVKPPWKNSKTGDTATILSGRQICRKRIAKVHRGSLAKIFWNINYKRIFPEASTIFDAAKKVKALYHDASVFMAFELEPYQNPVT